MSSAALASQAADTASSSFSAAGIIELAGAMIVLGIFMAFSPTTFSIELKALSRPERLVRNVLIIAIGVVVSSTVLTALLLGVSQAALDSFWNDDIKPVLVEHGLDLLAGLIMIGAGIVGWVRAARPRRPRATERLSLDHPVVLGVVVALNSGIGTSSVATIYLVVRMLRTQEPWVWPIGYAIYLGALVMPYVALAYAWTQMPRTAERINSVFTKVAAADLRRPGALLLAVVGTMLASFAVWGFVADKV